MNRKRNGLLSLAVAGGLMIAALAVTGIYFQTNDDKCITEILAGTFAEGPDAHTVYVNYLLSLPLSLLYRVTARIPWYGGTLLLFQGLAYGFLLDSFYDGCQKKREYVYATALGVGFFLLNYCLLGQIQYTSTAALLGFSGYFCLLLQTNSRKGMAFFGLLELAAFLLRAQAMLMVQPLGLAVYAGVLLGKKGFRVKKVPENEAQAAKQTEKQIGKQVAPLLILGVVLLIGWAGNAMGYRGDEWKEYGRANEARTAMFDYYGAPSYEEAKPILDRYGINEVTYTAYLNYVMPYGEIPAECASELAAFSGENRESAPKVWQTVKTMGRYILRENCQGINYVVLILWGMALAAAIWLWRKGDRALLWPLLGLGAARTAVWAYLIAGGRLPYRLTLPLFAGEAMLLAVILLGSARQITGGHSAADTGGTARNVFAQMAVLFCGFCLIAGVFQIREMKRENQKQAQITARYREILQTCAENSENRYLLDAITFSEVSGGALETEMYRQGNYAVTGNWYSGSPVMAHYMEKFCYRKDGEDLYLIVRDDGRGAEHPAVRYLSEKSAGEQAAGLTADPPVGPDAEPTAGQTNQDFAGPDARLSEPTAERLHTADGTAYLIWRFPLS